MTISIRQEQNDAFAEAHYRGFESRAIRHLRRFFPDQVSRLSEDQKRALIAQMVSRARKYGLESEQAVMCFAHLPLLLGDDFDSNRRYQFAPRILKAQCGHAVERAKLAMLLAYEFKKRGL